MTLEERTYSSQEVMNQNEIKSSLIRCHLCGSLHDEFSKYHCSSCRTIIKFKEENKEVDVQGIGDSLLNLYLVKKKMEIMLDEYEGIEDSALFSSDLLSNYINKILLSTELLISSLEIIKDSNNLLIYIYITAKEIELMLLNKNSNGRLV